MSEVKQKLFDNQAEAVRKREVFSNIKVCKEKGDGTVSKELDEGVIFIAGNVKLMSKDGSNNIMLAIGLDDYEGKVDVGACKFFRPTTFEDLATAFQYTEPKALENFFRSAGANNSNLNALICSFLNCNLDSQTVDVKALASTSLQIKEIVDEKSQQYYDEKVAFYTNKIQKYQSKIQSLRQEQSGMDEQGEFYEETECSMGTVLDNYIQSVSDTTSQQVQVGVDKMIEYINSAKETVVEEENPTLAIKPLIQNQTTQAQE